MKRVKCGFTLVELLVVIAIIGILIALLLPAVQAAREAARRTTCSNKFKQIGLALLSYESANKSFPAGVVYWNHDRDGTTSGCGVFPTPPQYEDTLGWAVAIMPFMEERTVYDQFSRTVNFGVAFGTDFAVLANPVPSYYCPSDPQAGEWVQFTSGLTNGPDPNDDIRSTNMAGVADSTNAFCNSTDMKQLQFVDGMMGNWQAAKLRTVTDGTSSTLFVGEVTGAGSGTKSGWCWWNMNVTDTHNGINGSLTVPGGLNPGQWTTIPSGFSSYHPGGCHFSFVDGSTHFLTTEISAAVLHNLTTRKGGETLGHIDY